MDPSSRTRASLGLESPPGWFCPQGHVVTSGSIYGCAAGGRGPWHLVEGGQVCSSHPTGHRTAPMQGRIWLQVSIALRQKQPALCDLPTAGSQSTHLTTLHLQMGKPRSGVEKGLAQTPGLGGGRGSPVSKPCSQLSHTCYPAGLYQPLLSRGSWSLRQPAREL